MVICVIENNDFNLLMLHIWLVGLFLLWGTMSWVYWCSTFGWYDRSCCREKQIISSISILLPCAGLPHEHLSSVLLVLHKMLAPDLCSWVSPLSCTWLMFTLICLASFISGAPPNQLSVNHPWRKCHWLRKRKNLEQLWQKCEQYLIHKDEMAKKDRIKVSFGTTHERVITNSVSRTRAEKAPPVDERIDYWLSKELPAGRWTNREKVIQPAGHLRRALMEWNLIEETDGISIQQHAS